MSCLEQASSFNYQLPQLRYESLKHIVQRTLRELNGHYDEEKNANY